MRAQIPERLLDDWLDPLSGQGLDDELLRPYDGLRSPRGSLPLPIMMRPQPMIAVQDVEACSTWFESVLGLRSGHGGTEYEMLMDGEDLVLQLHRWDVDEHPLLGDPHDATRGNGILLWFATNDIDHVVSRATDLGVRILDGPLFNPNAQQVEIWIEGPEGYRVVVAGPRG